MSSEANTDLPAAYIAFARAKKDSPEYQENFWAFDKFCDLCIAQPVEAWDAILEILSRDPGPEVLRILAAGPMEELLVNHGQQIIDRVEERARNDARVARLLGGVWKSQISDAVWKRIDSVRSHVW